MVERFLTILDNEEDESATDVVETSYQQSGISVQESEKMWPPWPWPPWDGDDGDGGDNEPSKRRDMRKLAKKVVDFESNIAEASLDL